MATWVNYLHSPDIVVLEEIQDNNGPLDNGVTSASETYKLLIDAIKTHGGLQYDWTDIAPENNQDGSEPGGNIRVGFLFRRDSEIILNYGKLGEALSATQLIAGNDHLSLNFNPGRIDPKNLAFKESRKPLVVSFNFRGNEIYLIGLHLISKGGDSPLFGRYQPANLISSQQRNKQAEVIREFIESIMRLNTNANIIVAGDLNDFQFSSPVRTLLGPNLINLVSLLPENEQYGYIYDGKGQVLDHILVSQAMAARIQLFINVHINSEFPSSKRVSDHDPSLVRLNFSNH